MTNEMDDPRFRYSDDLDGFSAFAQWFARTVFEDGAVGITIIADATGKPPFITQLVDSTEDPMRTLAAMQSVFEKNGVERAAKIGECWVSKYPKEQGIPANAPPPSLDPNRREMMSVVVRDRNGKGLMSLAEIIRPAEGPPQLGPWKTFSWRPCARRRVALNQME